MSFQEAYFAEREKIARSLWSGPRDPVLKLMSGAPEMATSIASRITRKTPGPVAASDYSTGLRPIDRRKWIDDRRKRRNWRDYFGRLRERTGPLPYLGEAERLAWGGRYRNRTRQGLADEIALGRIMGRSDSLQPERRLAANTPSILDRAISGVEKGLHRYRTGQPVFSTAPRRGSITTAGELYTGRIRGDAYPWSAARHTESPLPRTPRSAWWG